MVRLPTTRRKDGMVKGEKLVLLVAFDLGSQDIVDAWLAQHEGLSRHQTIHQGDQEAR
jgi:hypothetical protein